MIQDAFVYGDNFQKNANMKSTVNRCYPLDPIGRVHLDSLELYPNTHMKKDTVIDLMLLVRLKLVKTKSYEGTLDLLYNNDFRKSAQYNIQDNSTTGQAGQKIKIY